MTAAASIIEVTLDATDPQALVQNDDGSYRPTPAGLAIAFQETSAATGWPEVTLRGPRAVVLDFIAKNWGADQVDVLLENEDVFMTELN